MIDTSLAGIAHRSPGEVADAFFTLEAAAQQVFPGSKDPRYTKEIGLAAVLASDTVGPNYLSPFNPDVTNRVAFLAHNQQDHPRAWEQQEILEGKLGGELPSGVGIFTGLALAQANEIRSTIKIRSYEPGDEKTGFGRIGLDGARRFDHSIVSTAGLRELHNGIVTQIFAEQVAGIGKQTAPKSVDEVAGRIVGVLDVLQSNYPTEVADMKNSGRNIFKLIKAAENILGIVNKPLV